MDRMGALMKRDYDWRAEIAELNTPTLLLFAEHDAVSTRHLADFFALFGGARVTPVGSERLSTLAHGLQSYRVSLQLWARL
jgi:hypothetical protein